jgi:DNA-binding GntR family transcriptional regulator
MKKNDTTVSKIAKFIRLEITYSRLKSGYHLKESEISEKFNVSRVPVREAFRILQSEGYLEVIRNRGSFVKSISQEYVIETAMCYNLLAPVVLEKAIPNYNDKTYAKADSVLKKVEVCTDFTKIGYLLWDFAKIIYGPSKMKFILGLFDDIYLHGIRSLNEIYEIVQSKHYDTTAHRKFLRLCKQNKKAKAIQIWMEHVNKIEQISMRERRK